MQELAPRSRSHARRRLLDAAEVLFADKGYVGASMRDISQAAGVPLGTATYHFREKEDLFREVLLRRVPEVTAALERNLAQAPADDVQAILEAYGDPMLEWLSTDDAGWRAYIRLLCMTGLQPAMRQLVEPTLEAHAPILESYRAALNGAALHVDPKVLPRIFYVYQNALLGVRSDLHWQRFIGPSDVREYGQMLAEMATQYAAGGARPPRRS